MVYIKDYWRPKGGEKESEIYQSLEEKNVPNIPRFYCGNNMCHEVHRNNVPQEVYETVPQPKTHSVIYYQMVLI